MDSAGLLQLISRARAQGKLEPKTKHRRNDPCHCGSGKKFKVCCRKKETEQRRQRLQAATQSKIVEAEDLEVAGTLEVEGKEYVD